MLAAPSLAGQHFAVIGLARTGLSVLRFLARSGATAIAWDDRAEARAEAAAAFPVLPLVAPDRMALSSLNGLLLSPGIPLNRDALAARARAAGLPILGDMELFQLARAGLPAHRLVGVTGTNGKSTATALIHHLLAAAGMPARLGGNIGLPILDQPPLPAGGVYVVELSSFQIDLCHSLSCDVACWTNLTPDHLDRHGDMEGYFAAKARLFAMQAPGATAILATDDAWTRRALAALPPATRPVAVSAADILPAVQARWPALPGPHNAQNAAIAIAAARALGASDNAIEQGLESFPGLPHRMELVSMIAGVRYVNDSKATNPASVAPALQAFPGIHWILGGEAKSADLDACLPHLSQVRAAYTIGEASALFAQILEAHVPVTEAGTLPAAVRAAAAAAKPGETVLLSPAAASFDQFRDFEDRGRSFRAAVRQLEEVA